MADECCAPGSEVMILSCSGGSNMGQIANRIAVDLTVEGLGKLFCLAGIGGNISGMIQSARDCPQVLVIDGCPLVCGQKTLERLGIEHHRPLILTDLGIEKNKDFALREEEVQEALKAARGICMELRAASTSQMSLSGEPACCP